MKRRKLTRVELALWVVFGVVVALGVATAAYAAHYSNHALPGVSVAGTSITGQTEEEVAQGIAQRAADVKIEVTVDGVASSFTPAELGVTVDPAATAHNAFAQNKEFGSRISALVKKQDVPVVLVQDDGVSRGVIDELIATRGTPATDATVSLAEDGVTFASTESQAGRSLDGEPIVAAALVGAQTLSSQTLAVETIQLDPVITTEAAQEAAATANALVALEITLNGRVDSHAPSPEQKAQWVQVPLTETGLGAPAYDPNLASAWLAETAESTQVEALPGVRNVNAAGKVVSTPKEGVTGYNVNNLDAVHQEFVAALAAGTPYTGTFTYDEVEPEYTTRLVATGSENLAYQAAPDEKWLDLNLGNNTVTAYVGASVVRGPIYIVPGMPGMETPTGTFNVYLKYQMQTMRGTNLDGTKYVAPDIPWVTYFTGSIAFHGAPWRDSFGWNGPGGSHGCVNMPSDAAKFIYDWAPMGTVVVSHY